VEEFNKVQFYRQCLRRPNDEIKGFHVGNFKMEEKLLVFILT